MDSVNRVGNYCVGTHVHIIALLGDQSNPPSPTETATRVITSNNIFIACTCDAGAPACRPRAYDKSRDWIAGLSSSLSFRTRENDRFTWNPFYWNLTHKMFLFEGLLFNVIWLSHLYLVVLQIP